MAQLGRATVACALVLAFVALPADGAVPVPMNLPVSAAQASVVPRASTAQERKAAVDKQLSSLRQDLEGTADDLVEAVLAMRRAKLMLGDARAELATARKELAIAQQRDLELSQRLQLATIGAAKAKKELQDSVDNEKASRTQIGRIASETYRSSAISTLSVALEAQSPEQFSAQMAVAGAALRVQNGAISRLQGQQAEGRAQRAKLNALKAQVGELKRQAAVVVQQRKRAEARATAAAAQVTSLVRGRIRALRTIRTRQAAERARLHDLAREQTKLKRILAEQARRARRSGHSQGGALAYPVNGPISSGFGWRIHPIFHYRRLHTGTDFAVACGTPVHAAKAGRVILAGWAGGYGNRVVIDHGLVNGVGLATTYNHLSHIVRSGGHVKKGQLIAYSGTTGSSTGCHLHFEVLVNGGFVNPMRWL